MTPKWKLVFRLNEILILVIRGEKKNIWFLRFSFGVIWKCAFRLNETLIFDIRMSKKNGEKKRGAEPFESIYLQFKIYKLISCYINIIGWWAGVRYIDAKTESCWSSDSACWQAKTDTKELSCASPIRDRQKAKLASSKQAEIWNILKSNIDFTQAQQLLHPTYRAGGSFLVLHHGIERTRSDSIDAVNID